MKILLYCKIIAPPPDSQVSPGVQQEETKDQDKPPTLQVAEGRYIVVFKDQAQGRISRQAAEEAKQRINAIFSGLGIVKDSLIHQYLHVSKGFAAHLSEEQAKALKNDPRVKTVTPDVYSKAIGINSGSIFSTSSVMQSGQTTPWGIHRVGGPLDKYFSNRAWILDSGIDLDHADLNVNTNLDTSAVSYTTNPDDDNGHGTYVAGIIAARDNNLGVVGVAPAAQVVSVKVCQSDSYCYVSDVLAGTNYVSNNFTTGDVANMSIGWPTYLQGNPYVDTTFTALEDAIRDAADNGLKFSILAHNHSEDADDWSPGRIDYNNVWTVSAIDDNDSFWQDSNYGNPPIDYAAPGVDVLSLWNDGGTRIESGTSASAPYVAGILLGCGESGLITDGTASNDPASPADPIAKANKLYYPSNITHSVVQSSPGYYNPKIDWNSLSGATEYQVWRKHWQGNWSHWATTSSTSHTDFYTNSQNLQAVSYKPSQYWVAYSIRAVNECGAGAWPMSPKYFKFDSGDSIPMAIEDPVQLQ